MAADFGFVYCLGNPSMPGIYKIGMTEFSPSRRAYELSCNSGVPTDFEVLFYIDTPTPRNIEAIAHKQFAPFRVSENREFFKLKVKAIHDWFDVYNQDGCPMVITRDGEFALGYHLPNLPEDLK